jgi:tRNA pseudouridine55 synthase
MTSEPVGLLLVDKPEGPTSHDVTVSVRRLIKTRRIGHAGTLDPFASGLLVLCVGWAARLAEYLTALPKVYHGVVRLGEVTDTDDLTGEVIKRSDAWRELAPDQISDAVVGQIGELEQRPPIYSAKKLAGERAYALARRGQRPQLVPRRVTVGRLTIRELALPDFSIEIECSSGTYVRSIARDLGEALGVGGHLTKLRRISVGDFSIDHAVRLGDARSQQEVMALLREPAAAVAHLAQVEVTATAGEALRQGRPVTWSEPLGAGPLAVHVEGAFLGIGELRDGRLWPKKVFPTQPVDD